MLFEEYSVINYKDTKFSCFICNLFVYFLPQIRTAAVKAITTFISDTRKHLCIEIVVSLAENAPSTMRKRGASYLGQLGKKFCRKLCSTIFECHSHPSLPCRVNYLLLMMTRLDEDDEWESEDSLEDDFER